jgi:hypothetical protein
MNVDLEKAKEILRQTPGTLTHMLQHLSDEWIYTNEGQDTWSPYDIVGHLIHGERTDWIQRVRSILEYGETRTFEPFDRFAQFEESKGKSISDLLETFAALREENLRVLDELGIIPEKLHLRGVHPDFGAVTLSQLLSTWVVHDLGHIAQISRVMAKQYAAEVGPWKAYLPMLTRV